MKGKSNTITKAGIVLLVISLLGFAISSVINPILFLPAVYLLILGRLLQYFNEKHGIYVFMMFTAAFLVLFFCWASLGFSLFFWPGCACGMVLSLYIYRSERFTPQEKRYSYLGVGLVIVACCYFFTRYLMYARFASIAVGVLVILHNLLTGGLSNKTNDQ